MGEALYFSKIITLVINVFIKSLESTSEAAWHTRAPPSHRSTSANRITLNQPVKSAHTGVAVSRTLTGSLLAWHPRVCTLFHTALVKPDFFTSFLHRMDQTGNPSVSPSIQQHEVQSIPHSQPAPSRKTDSSLRSVLWLCALGLDPARAQPILLPGCSHAQLALPPRLLNAYLPALLPANSFLQTPCWSMPPT